MSSHLIKTKLISTRTILRKYNNLKNMTFGCVLKYSKNKISYLLIVKIYYEVKYTIGDHQ